MNDNKNRILLVAAIIPLAGVIAVIIALLVFSRLSSNNQKIVSTTEDKISTTIVSVINTISGETADESETDLSGYDNIKAGTQVYYGSYEQDNNNSNGKEKIKWIVLERNGNNIMLMSVYALDCKIYNSMTDVTWETSSIRSWLNDDFYNTAFTEKEKNYISTTNVINSDNSVYGTSGGNDTQDKIYLLSLAEVEKYLPDKSDRDCLATAYADENGTWVSETYGCCEWFLRSPGENSEKAAVIGADSDFYYGGNYVNYNGSGIRPVMWIHLV